MESIDDLEKQFAKNSDKREALISLIKNLKDGIKKDLEEAKAEYIKDDLELKSKYDALVNQTKKIMPMILRSEKPELIKMLTNKLRRHMPKAFFAITKASIKDVRKG